MTTTAFDDQFTPATQTILRVNVIESQQQIHDLQTRLAAAIERAEKAEAELANLAQQKPVAWRHENGNIFLPWQKDLITTSAVFSPLYAAPVHAPAVPAVPDGWMEWGGGSVPPVLKYAEVGAAIERAAKDLPYGDMLEITVEKDSAMVVLYWGQGGFETMDVDDDNRLAAEINAAIDAARSAKT